MSATLSFMVKRCPYRPEMSLPLLKLRTIKINRSNNSAFVDSPSNYRTYINVRTLITHDMGPMMLLLYVPEYIKIGGVGWLSYRGS